MCQNLTYGFADKYKEENWNLEAKIKEERDNHERTIEGLKTALRQQEANTS